MKPKYTFDKSSRYMTRGINEIMPLSIQIILWSSIDQVVESELEVDYLQVFKFSEEKDSLIITHTQEQPEYIAKFRIKLDVDNKILVGKTVFVIDDIDHSTMLLASEY